MPRVLAENSVSTFPTGRSILVSRRFTSSTARPEKMLARTSAKVVESRSERPPRPPKRHIATFLVATKRKNDDSIRYERTVPDEKSPEDMSTTCASRSISPNAGLPSGAQARSAAHPPRGIPISRRSDAHAAAAAWRNIELMATDTAHQSTPCSISARKAGQKPSTPIPASADGA